MNNVCKSTIANMVKAAKSDDVPAKFVIDLIGTSVSK
jgi:uncharacterized protein (DUF983 family)